MIHKDTSQLLPHCLGKKHRRNRRIHSPGKSNAQERFYRKLAGITEPEQKRKIIGEEFIRVFEEEAKKIGAVDFLVQGTIYPDVIESGLGKSAVIKSHHNVGGLPDCVDFREIIEPHLPGKVGCLRRHEVAGIHRPKCHRIIIGCK